VIEPAENILLIKLSSVMRVDPVIPRQSFEYIAVFPMPRRMTVLIDKALNFLKPGPRPARPTQR
jgi:hypothetical protein